MGRGDKRSTRGKIWRGSYGKSRSKKTNRPHNPAAEAAEAAKSAKKVAATAG